MATGQLEAIIEPAVAALGYELVGIEYLGQGRHSLLRVYIDSENGITVDDCEQASRQISAVMDVEDPIRGQYTLEVSSPGMERPLFKPEHYERFKGNQVQLRLRIPIEGRRKYVGELQGMRGEDVVVIVDGQERTFPLQDIEKANLKAEW